MKTLTEYLERALEFENLAHAEQNETFKAELLRTANAYRKTRQSARNSPLWSRSNRYCPYLTPTVPIRIIWKCPNLF
jgi:hypothetical protein